MANLQAMRVDETGVWLRSPAGLEAEITSAEIKAQHDSLGSKGAVAAWLAGALAEALPSAGIDAAGVTFDYDEATGGPIDLIIGSVPEPEG